MSSPSTNITTRRPAGQAPSLTEVYTLSDLPVASGGIRDFGFNEGLDLKASIFEPNIWRWPSGSRILVRSDDQLNTTVFYTGTGTFINCLGATATVEFNNVLIVSATQTARFCDLTAGTAIPPIANNLVFLKAGFILWGGGGSLTGYIAGSFKEWFVDGLSQPFTLNSCQAMDVSASFFSGTGMTKRPLFAVQGPFTFQCNVHHSFLNAPGAQSSLSIERSVTTNGFVIMSANVNAVPSGLFYKPTTSTVIGSVANNLTTSNVASVENDSFMGARFVLAASQTVPTPGDVIAHSTFTDGTYNGDFVVVDVDVANETYTVGQIDNNRAFVEFQGVTDSGIFTRQYVNMVTTDTSNIILGDGVNITGLPNYNGEHQVKQIITDTSFAISAPFIAGGTGSYTAGSLVETDNRVDVSNSGEVRPSETIALGALNNETQVTTIANNDQYVPINVTGFTANIVMERFELDDAATGRFKYIGKNNFQGFVSGVVTMFVAGNNIYRLAMSFNQGMPLFTEIGTTPILEVLDSPTTPGRARFRHNGTSPTLGTTVNISGFVINTQYNARDICVFQNVNNFEILGVNFVADEVAGSYIGERANYILVDIKSASVTVPLLFMAKLRPNDTIQIMVAGQGTNADPQFNDFSFGIF